MERPRGPPNRWGMCWEGDGVAMARHAGDEAEASPPGMDSYLRITVTGWPA